MPDALAIDIGGTKLAAAIVDADGVIRSRRSTPTRAADAAGLFHLLNQSMRDHRPMLLTAREPVANWPFTTNDLKSRARLAASRDGIGMSSGQRS